MSEDYENIDNEFEEFTQRMKDVTASLKRLEQIATRWRFQIGGTDDKDFAALKEEMKNSQDGWMSSMC